PLKVRVENAIATLLPHGEMHFDAVAAKLGMSGRTLSRKLALEGHSFSGIVNDLRLGFGTSLFGRKRHVDFRNRLAFGIF
ncbi:MAG: hypothetical protein WB685_16800, partial [Pseudolabrys sp.]